MKKLNLILALAVSFSLFACGEKNQETPVVETQQSEEAHQHDEANHDEHASAEGPIELDNGQAWKVNDEMKPYIESGETLLKTYVSEGDKDYKALAAKLKEENNKLIKSCTMDGKSHEELHKWLHPHIELLDKLEQADSPETAQQVVDELFKSMEVYHSHFQ